MVISPSFVSPVPEVTFTLKVGATLLLMRPKTAVGTVVNPNRTLLELCNLTKSGIPGTTVFFKPPQPKRSQGHGGHGGGGVFPTPREIDEESTQETDAASAASSGSDKVFHGGGGIIWRELIETTGEVNYYDGTVVLTFIKDDTPYAEYISTVKNELVRVEGEFERVTSFHWGLF